MAQLPGQAHEPAHFRLYGDYAGTAPAFYPADDFPWVRTLRDNWRTIRDEYEDYVHRQGHTLRPNFVPDAVEITGWRGVNFFTYLRQYRTHCRHFPRTVEVLNGIPNLASAFINLLEPHSSLPPHFGETNTLYRVHLGLIIPAGLDECGFQVEDQRTEWREGEVIVFNDARRHFVWNHASRPRVILVCDVMKDEYGGATPRACARVLGAIVVVFLQSRLTAMRRLPRRALSALHATASLPFRVYLSLFGFRPPTPGAPAAR